jgi:O6-methylguanine-DNA--protein-cysteine methyltransferase
VIRIGAYLGWAETDVASFAERLTGRSWQACQTAELGQVVGTYAEIATRIRARLSDVKP